MGNLGIPVNHYKHQSTPSWVIGSQHKIHGQVQISITRNMKRHIEASVFRLNFRHLIDKTFMDYVAASRLSWASNTSLLNLAMVLSLPRWLPNHPPFKTGDLLPQRTQRNIQFVAAKEETIGYMVVHRGVISCTSSPDFPARPSNHILPLTFLGHWLDWSAAICTTIAGLGLKKRQVETCSDAKIKVDLGFCIFFSKYIQVQGCLYIESLLWEN